MTFLVAYLFFFYSLFLCLLFFYKIPTVMFFSSTYPHHGRRILHMIYFPWDRQTQKLQNNPYDFDQASYHQMRENHPSFEIRLWTLPETRSFVQQHYPGVWETLLTLSRPVMMIDVLRWMIVFHYGGIYWQYGSTPLCSLDHFLPKHGKSVRLFTETILTPEFSRHMGETEPIRQGEPEELTRVYTAVFSASFPKDPYFHTTLSELFSMINTHPIVRRDYDILYITGNARVSTIYHRYGRHDPHIELVPLDQTRKMIKINSASSWRTEPSS